MKQPVPPARRIALAAVAATVGIVVAVIVDSPVWSGLIAAVTATVAVILVGSLRAREPKAALWGALAVAGAVLVVGLPAVAVLAPSDGATTTPGDSGEASKADAGVVDLSAALARTLDRADQVAPEGSTSILSIEIKDDRESLYVLNQKNGRMVYTYRSGDGDWFPPYSTSTSQRVVFGRADLKGLDLGAAGRRATTAWDRFGGLEDGSGLGVTIAPRTRDEKLVATFTGGAFPIEADTGGRLADTLDAASVGGFLDVARRVMTAEGVDPNAKVLREIAFKSLSDGAWSSGRHQPGFDLTFDGGPVQSIAVDVGAFPEIRTATTDDRPDGFSLTGLTGATMASVRDDLARRGKVPAYDHDVVGAKVGVASNDERPGRVPVTIQMVVGPGAREVGGVYSTRGQFLRDGTD